MTAEDAKQVVEFIKDQIPYDKIKDCADAASYFGSDEFKDMCGKISDMTDMAENTAVVMDIITDVVIAQKNPEQAPEYMSKAMSQALQLTGTFAEFAPVFGSFLSDVLNTAADCLLKGVELVNSYVDQLKEIEEAIEGSNKKDIKGMARNLQTSSNMMTSINQTINKLQATRDIYRGMGANTEDIDEQLDVLEKQRKIFGDEVETVISKVNKIMGTNFSDLNEMINKMMSMSDDELSKSFSARIDPLVFDLGNDGFDIQKKKDGTYFDLNCDGFAERVNWTSTDAILAMDVNGNGMIDDGSEVFGDRHLMNDGKIPETDFETVSTGIYMPPSFKQSISVFSEGGGETGSGSLKQTVQVKHAKSGFEALAQYDINDDGIIDKNDDVYKKLLLWVDANGDGISQKEELKSLEELGIASIDLNYLEESVATNSEAVMKKTSSFTYENGTTGKFGEMWVAADLFDTVEKEVPDIAEAIKELPDVRGFGKVSSLHVAMTRDKTGKLENLVREFLKEPDREKQYELVEDILDILCDVEDKNYDTRGANIEERKIIVVEQIMGRDFIDNTGSIVPNQAAAPMIEGIYQDIVDTYYYSIIGGEVKKYFDCMFLETLEDGTQRVNTELFNSYVQLDRSLGNMDDVKFGHVMSFLAYSCKNQWKDFGALLDFRNYFSEVREEDRERIDKEVRRSVGRWTGDLGGSLNGSDECNILYGGLEKDVLNGNAGSDFLVGGAGDDTLNGGGGDDYLVGGTGNDTLDGGAGNDTYYIEKGDGNDRINDAYGDNVIRFGEGITVDQLSARRSGRYDVAIMNEETGEMLTLVNFMAGVSYRNYTFEFADGTTIKADAPESPLRRIKGTSEKDVLNMVYSEGGSTVYGLEGNDTIYGSNGDDYLYGGAGDDTLNGGGGNDYLVGGTGNDTLDGGVGDDTYYIEKGDGNDRITDSYGNNVIRFGEGITVDQLSARRSGRYDVAIMNEETGEVLTLANFMSGVSYRNYTFEFADGTSVTNDQVNTSAIVSNKDTSMYDILVQTLASYDNSDGMMELAAYYNSSDHATANSDLLFVSH